MKFHYYEETDSLYIDLSSRKSKESIDVSPGVVIDYAKDGRIVGIDIQHASKVVDLSSIESDEIPMKKPSFNKK